MPAMTGGFLHQQEARIRTDLFGYPKRFWLESALLHVPEHQSLTRRCVSAWRTNAAERKAERA